MDRGISLNYKIDKQLFKAMNSVWKVFVLIFLFFSAFCVQDGLAQSKKSHKPKSTREAVRNQSHARDSILQSYSKTDTSVNSLLQRIGQYTSTFNQINNTLAEGLDTADISEQIPELAKRLKDIHTLANDKKPSSLRYLTILRDDLDHIQDQVEDIQTDLEEISSKLIQNQHDIVRFSKDSLLRSLPDDSLLRGTFFAHQKKVKLLWQQTDVSNRNSLLKVNLLQDKVSDIYSTILDETDKIDAKIVKFADGYLDGDFDYIWNTRLTYKDFASSITNTIELNKTQLLYFIYNETTTHFISLIVILLVVGWLIYIWLKIRNDDKKHEKIDDSTNYISQSPIIASLITTSVITPFFYNQPPVLFTEGVLLVGFISILVLIKRNLPKSIFNFLHLLFWLFVICGLSNLLIRITSFDRMVILLVSIISIISAVGFYKKVQTNIEAHLPYTKLVLKLFIIIQFVSVVLNIAGRFSLAKIIAITAIYNLWMLVALYFIVEIIIQGLFLQFHTQQKENSITNLMDYSLIQKKFLGLLGTLGAIAWLYFLLQNLNVDDWVRDYLATVLNQSRTIGGASFTFGGFVIFIAVIWLSSVASKIISYFYDVSARNVTDLSALKKKNRASTLLIRMGVFTTGFLLAVAASGFPLDKLTIIFSAFGVGIGFGLQNIVNNLVSGLILAFEKPVQIGDIIEVNNRSGTIKEIGVRSSKLATSDGSEVIIPNGDLISQNVVNWTLSNSNRRIELIISVAYGTDIQAAKTLLTNLMSVRGDIMTKPAPSVFLNGVNDKSVDFRIFCWADDLSSYMELKSRILTDIYEALKKEGIVLPVTT